MRLDTFADQAAVVAILVAVASAIALALRPTGALAGRFALLATTMALHFVGSLIDAEWPLLPSFRLIAGAAATIAALFFFDGVLADESRRTARLRRMGVATAAAVAVLGLTPVVHTAVGMIAGTSLLLAIVLFRVMRVLLRTRQVHSMAERTRLAYLGGGGVLVVVSIAMDALARSGVDVPPLGGVVTALFLYFLSQAISAARLLDLHELLGKMLVFGSLALILAIVYGVLFVSVGERRLVFLSNTVVASIIILILFEPLKLRLEESSARFFFREEFTFVRTLRQVQSSLQTTIELPAAFGQTLDALYDSKRATHTSLYLLEPASMAFALADHRGPPPAASIDARTLPALFAHFMQAASPLWRETLLRRATRAQRSLSEDENKALPKEAALLRDMDHICADVVIPLRVQGNVAGCLALRDERLRDAFAPDELAALMELADQLAINVENTRLFGLLSERDRLAALGEMSAGLAHEIRNPLAAIKGAAQELKPQQLQGEDAELLQVIVDEVNRLNSVVSGFLDYARPFRGTFVAFAVNDVVKRTAQLMQHDLANIDFEFVLEPTLPDVNGDPERLQQVIINLVINAAESMDRRGRIVLTTKAASRSMEHTGFGARHADAIEVVIRDHGPGIPKAIRPQLFIPFFTTKKRGTGLGLALCQRIVQHHGGRIEVQSVEAPAADHGTRFVIRLPGLPKRSLPPSTPTTPVG
jgi:two-component system, NtrC family, sensor histidine kinase HydH